MIIAPLLAFLAFGVESTADCALGPVDLKVYDERANRIDRRLKRDDKCAAYVDVGGSVTDITALFTFDSSVDGLDLPPGVSGTVTPMSDDKRRWRIVFRAVNRSTQEIQFLARHPAGSNAATTETKIDVLLARVPKLRLRESESGCDASTLCIPENRQYTFVLEGENLDEIALEPPKVYFTKPGEPKVNTTPSFDAVRSGPDILVRLSQTAVAALKTGDAFDITLNTKSPFYPTSAGDSKKQQVVVPGLAIRKLPEPFSELRFGDKSSGELTLFVGETAILPFVPIVDDKKAAIAVQTRLLYSIVEGRGETARQVAIMEFLDQATLRITAIVPTSAPFRRTGFAELSVVEKDIMKFHTHLQVVSVPKVTGIEVRHSVAAYTGNILRQAERAQISITGQGLLAFDSVTTDARNGALALPARLRTDREVVLDVDVAPGASNNFPIKLTSSIVRDTIIQLPISPALLPHPLDFARVGFETKEKGKWKLNTLNLKSAAEAFRTRRLSNVRINFDPLNVSDASAFGPQYIVVHAGYYDADGTTILKDSARVVLVPQVNTHNPLIAGFSLYPEVRVDELLKNSPRHARPGAYLELVVQHDAAQYGAEKGQASKVRLINGQKFRISPRLDLLTGLTYFAQSTTTDVKRTTVPNGAASDTLVRRIRAKEWAIDLFDVTGGAAAAVDLEYLRYDQRPSLARLRVAVLAVSDPFSNPKGKRRIGAAALYPFELLDVKGVVSLSLAVGVGKLVGGRSFGVIAPGLGFTFPKVTQ